MSETSPENPPPAVLDYATYDADGLPSWVPEAEKLIDLHQPPRTIRPFFRTSNEAAGYFAKSMRRRFSIPMVGDRCNGCGQEPCRTAVGVRWSAEMPGRAFEYLRFKKTNAGEFVTHHSLCKRCGTRWYNALRFIRVASYVPRLARWSWIPFFYLMIQTTQWWFWNSSYAGWFLPGYFALVAISDTSVRALIRRSVPQGIAASMPPKVDLVTIESFDYRERLAAAGAITEKA